MERVKVRPGRSSSALGLQALEDKRAIDCSSVIKDLPAFLSLFTAEYSAAVVFPWVELSPRYPSGNISPMILATIRGAFLHLDEQDISFLSYVMTVILTSHLPGFRTIIRLCGSRDVADRQVLILQHSGEVTSSLERTPSYGFA